MQYCTADQTDLLTPPHVSCTLIMRVAACARASCMEENRPIQKNSFRVKHKFLVDKSGLDIASEQCVCRACELKYKGLMKKRDSEEVSRFRWQVQRELCSVPLCFAVSNIQKYLFTWRDICNTIGIASIECDPVLHKALCTNHYQLVYRFVNAQ